MPRRKKGADDQAAADVDVTTTEPTQPTLDLPEYHGRKPIGQKTSLNGAGTRVKREHEIGERVVLVIEAKAKKAGHEDTDDGLVYTETLKVVDMFEVEAKPASRLLAALRQQAKTLEDTGKRTPLAVGAVDLGTVGYTDASGVVLTDKELAEIQGNPVAAFGTTGETFVIVFDNLERAVWPDEFPPDTIRPNVGDLVQVGDPVTTGAVFHGASVAAILDGVTGEPLEGEEPGLPAESAESGREGGTDRGWVDQEGIADDHLPTAADFDLVAANSVDALRDELEDITDLDQLRRILNAEKQGRGTGAKARGGAIVAIGRRIDVVANSTKLKLDK
jgi:hypothetical protein